MFRQINYDNQYNYAYGIYLKNSNVPETQTLIELINLHIGRPTKSKSGEKLIMNYVEQLKDYNMGDLFALMSRIISQHIIIY